jgi:hypothetical protein
MKIEVYHMIDSDFSDDGKQFSLRDFEHVANVHGLSEVEPAMNALEYAYEKTNHIQKAWTENFGVESIGGIKHRSTSVGDLMEFNGTWYLVTGFGFEKVVVK